MNYNEALGGAINWGEKVERVAECPHSLKVSNCIFSAIFVEQQMTCPLYLKSTLGDRAFARLNF